MKGCSKSDAIYVIYNLIWLMKAGGINLQPVTKIMAKTAIWTILSFSPLPPLKNVEKQ